MRRAFSIVTILVVMMAAATVAAAPDDDPERKLWSNMCASCHDGSTAPTRETLKEKYQTVENFQEAVIHKGGRCMNLIKNDKGLIRRIGQEIGLED